VVGGGGGEFGEAVGAGCGEWNAGGADEGKRDRMRGHAETNRGKVGGNDGRDARLLVELFVEFLFKD
jgi:hypothetical protein